MIAFGEDDAAAALDFDEAVSVTDTPARCAPWRADFEASAEWVSHAGVRLPRNEALLELCAALDFPEVAVHDLMANRHTWDDARIRRLGAHVQWMIAKRYSAAGYQHLGWPRVFSRWPLFYAYAALGLARQVAEEQAARGIDPETTQATLRDIGQQVFLHRRIYREVGMNKGWWLSHHLSHHLHRLGRLQFQRSRAPVRLGPVAADEALLDVHIPEGSPLDPTGCDVSFERARRFFARHFPDETPRLFACTSWLLDPVLAEFLPVGSNIVRFQRRFEIQALRPAPSSVFEFLFDRPDLDRTERPDLSTLPCDTRLRAAIVEHYASGGVIRMGVGTLTL